MSDLKKRSWQGGEERKCEDGKTRSRKAPIFDVFARFLFLRFIVFTVLVCAPALSPARVCAQELFQKMDTESFGDSSERTWDIEALRITYDHTSQQYTAEGGVRITSGDRSLRADWAQLDTVNRVVELRGNVFLQYGPDWLRGEHAVWDLESETGWVNGGMVYFDKSHFYVKGEHIAKTGPNNYELERGFVTTCDPDSRDWVVRYEDMEVNTEGIAWIKHPSFWVRNKLPCLYFPLVALPAKRERQSGFLIPDLGLSDLNGFEAELPFFWDMRRDMDATLYLHYFEKRGWMGGTELRFDHDKWGKGMVLAHYLSDGASKGHLEDQGYPFEQKDRYWIRSRYSFELPHEIRGRMDVDTVSDRNFLKEFETGSVSYDHSDSVFRRFFGRGILNDKTVLARESNLYLNKAGQDALLGLDVHYWDNLDREQNEVTLQQLPNLTFDVVPDWLGPLPMYYTLETEWVDYWRREGDRGNRVDLRPRLHYPLHWKSYLNVEPSAGVRVTSYWVDWDDPAGDPDSMQNRVLPDAEVLLTSRLNRVYSWGEGDKLKLQHAVRPEVTYEYTPEVEQNDLPFFDRLDRIPMRHNVRYGFSTFLTAKRVQDNPEGDPVTHYGELGRLRVTQAYRIKEPDLFEEDLEPEEIEDLVFGETDLDKRFSDILLEFDLTPGQYVDLSYDTAFSATSGKVSGHNLLLSLDTTLGQSLLFNYEFLRDGIIDELTSSLYLDVTRSVSLNFFHNYSFNRKEMFRQGYGLNYRRGCWGVTLGYSKEAEDQRVSLSLNLLGLGEVGGGVSFGGEEPGQGEP